MNYRVEWTEEAEQRLAAVWMEAEDRAAVTAAARRLEQSLGYNPFGAGEARDDFDARLAFDGPIGMFYRVDVFARAVIVVSVGRSGQTA
jgi:hypothetical protein